LSAASQLTAPRIARRIGLVNTMLFTHVPANLCLIGAALAPTLELALGLLLARSALSQMDVPARSAFVMTVVTPEERPAAASFTAVPRSLASAVSPSLTGAMFAAGTMAAPLVICGVLKTAYDLALFTAFRRAEPCARPRPPAGGARRRAAPPRQPAASGRPPPRQPAAAGRPLPGQAARRAHARGARARRAPRLPSGPWPAALLPRSWRGARAQ